MLDLVDHSGHGGHGAHGGGLNLLPLWMQLVWLLAMAAVVAAHSIHVAAATGLAVRQIRAWHGTHLLMGVGMIYMFTPWSGGFPGSVRAWQWVFGVAAVLVGGWIAATLQRGQRVDTHWLLSVIGLGVMAYMFFVHRGHGTPAVTYILVGYFIVEAACWAQGWLTRCSPTFLPAAVGPAAGIRAVSLRCATPSGLRVSQTTMALSMAYMFLAMDTGAREFFDKAYGQPFSLGLNGDVGLTEQTLWASCLVALVVLACIPRRRERPAVPDGDGQGVAQPNLRSSAR